MNIRYHLLTYENDTFTARTYKFCIKDDQLESDCISESALVSTHDIKIAKYELRDFRVSEELNQYQTLFRLKEGYKSLEVKNFALLIFSTLTGEIEAIQEFNLGAE